MRERGEGKWVLHCASFRVDHCHQEWLMALLLHVNTAVRGWEITGTKRYKLQHVLSKEIQISVVCFFSRVEVPN